MMHVTNWRKGLDMWKHAVVAVILGFTFDCRDSASGMPAAGRRFMLPAPRARSQLWSGSYSKVPTLSGPADVKRSF